MVDLVHPLKLGRIDQEKTAPTENWGPERKASDSWPINFENDWEEIILLNDWVKANERTKHKCACIHVYAYMCMHT